MEKTSKQLVQEILDEKKISKWRLAKSLHVTWATVHFWHRGIFEASKENYKKLKLLWK